MAIDNSGRAETLKSAFDLRLVGDAQRQLRQLSSAIPERSCCDGLKQTPVMACPRGSALGCDDRNWGVAPLDGSFLESIDIEIPIWRGLGDQRLHCFYTSFSLSIALWNLNDEVST